jgi:hypothetical protein
MRRRPLLGYGISALFATPALARLPHGSASPSSGSTTSLTLAAFTNAGMAGSPSQIVLAYTGAAPSSFTATWSGGGGSASFTGIQTQGPFVTAYATLPSAGTYTLNSITGGGASAGNTGNITVSAAVADFASGIHGPSTVVQGQDAFGNGLLQGLASYFVRGMKGAITWTLSDTVGGSNDSSFFSISPYINVVWKLSYGAQLNSVGQNASQTSFAITVTATDATGAALSLPVTVQNPAAPTVTLSGNVVCDSATFLNFNGAISVAFPVVWGGGTSSFSDSLGILTNVGGMINISPANLAANIGNTTIVTMQATGGAVQTFPIYIVHDTVQVSWKPNGAIYSSTPATNGYGGWSLTDCHQIGTLLASADSFVITNTLTSNPSGALNIYSYDTFVGRTGYAFLLASQATGTLSGTCQSATYTGTVNNMVFSLPILAGTTASPSNATITPVGGLTNWQDTSVTFPGVPVSPDVTFTNGALSGNTLTFTSASGTPTVGMIVYSNSGAAIGMGSNPVLIAGSITGTSCAVSNPANVTASTGTIVSAKMPVTVATVSISGFTPVWSKTLIDVLGDNCQLIPAPSNLAPAPPYLPRYAIYGTGASTAIIVAWNLSAIDPSTPQIDHLKLDFTDGNGTYCTQTVDISVAWHAYTGAALSVGPLGSGATWTDTPTMQAALWASPATYAGAVIKVLDGVDSLWNYNPLGGSSYGGWYRIPLEFQRDSTTQASFAGTITGVSGTNIFATGTLTVSSVTGTININDFTLIGGVAAGIIITSGSGSTWTVTGPGVVAMSSIAMTTQHQQFYVNMNNNASAGNHQGGLAGGGGSDIIYRGAEVGFTSNGHNAGAIYKFNRAAGNISLIECYLHDSDMGFEGGDYGCWVRIINSLIGRCGFDGNSHNIYTDGVAHVIMTGCNSTDSLAHEFKARAMNATITGNSFIEGCNWFGSGTPFQNCQGGVWNVSNNVIIKGCNGANANNGNIVETYNECSGGIGVYAHEAWAVNQFNFDSNMIISTYASGQPVVAFFQYGGNSPANLDNIRNIPFGYAITNTSIGNLPTGQWTGGVLGATPPPLGAGNILSTTLDLSRTTFINPLTGAQPIRNPRAFGGLGRMAAEPSTSSALAPYVTIPTVPTGSGAATNVTGGLISGYDANAVQMTGISASISVDSSQFSISVASPTAQIKTVGSLADGIYFPQVTMSGTGTAPLPVPQYFPVVVGAG